MSMASMTTVKSVKRLTVLCQNKFQRNLNEPKTGKAFHHIVRVQRPELWLKCFLNTRLKGYFYSFFQGFCVYFEKQRKIVVFLFPHELQIIVYFDIYEFF